jgi:YbbR domain-containing protein
MDGHVGSFSKNGRRSMVKDNLLLKLVSLLAAILLAYSVNSDRNTSVLSFNVPIEIKNPPEDKVLVKPTRRLAQVTVRGPSFLVGPLVSSPPPLKVVVPDEVGERLQVSLKGADLSVPSMIEVVGVEPAEIELVFEPVERKDFKIEVPRVGQLSKELTLSRVDVEPKVATVKGPRSELKQLRFIESEPLDLSDLSKTQSLTLALRDPGNQSGLITKSVSVRVSINEVPRQRIFEKRPVELRTSPNVTDITIEPTEVTVILEGPPAVVAEVDPGSILPFVRVKDPPSREGRVIAIDVEVPEGCTATKIEPASALVFKESGRKMAIQAKSEKNSKKASR